MTRAVFIAVAVLILCRLQVCAAISVNASWKDEGNGYRTFEYAVTNDGSSVLTGFAVYTPLPYSLLNAGSDYPWVGTPGPSQEGSDSIVEWTVQDPSEGNWEGTQYFTISVPDNTAVVPDYVHPGKSTNWLSEYNMAWTWGSGSRVVPGMLIPEPSSAAVLGYMAVLALIRRRK